MHGLLGTDGQIAEQDEFSEGGGVVEVRAGQAAIHNVVRPLALRIVRHHAARLRLLDLAGLHVQADLGVFVQRVDDRALAVRIPFEHDAVGADEHHAAGGLFEGVFRDVGMTLRLVRHAVLLTIVPGDRHGGVFAGGHVIDQLAPHGGVEVGDGAAFGFDLLRNELAQDAEAGIHDVAAHVSQSAGAELPPAAPVERCRAGAAQLFLGGGGVEVKFKVGLGRLAGQPEVPVKVRRALDQLFLYRSLRPDRAVRPQADFLEGANGTLLDPLLGHALAIHRPALIAHLGDDFRLLGGAVQITHLRDVIAQGLLHADVLAVFDGMHRGEVVRVVGGGDDDAVDLVRHFVEHLAEVLIELRRRRGGLAGVKMVLLTLLRGFLQALGVHIHHGDDVVVERDHARVGQTFAVGSDLDQIQAFAGGVLTPEEEVGAGECAGGEAGGGGEKVAA